jgi:hypothetical protein
MKMRAIFNEEKVAIQVLADDFKGVSLPYLVAM